MTRRERAAFRDILKKGEGTEPVRFLEAAFLEQDATKRRAAFYDTAVRIARSSNPKKAAQDVAKDFLSEPPRIDTVPDDGQFPDESMRRQRHQRRLRFAAEDPMQQPAPAASPGDEVDDGTEIGPIETSPADDDKRTLDEQLGAVFVLGLAARMSTALEEPVRRIALNLRLVTERMKDKSARAQLRNAADDLVQNANAAGTMPLPQTTAVIEDEEAGEAAIGAGEDPALAMKFSQQWRELREHGCPSQLSRQQYIAVNQAREAQNR